MPQETNKASEIEDERVESEVLGDVLTRRQEEFCQLYATDREFFGNGVQTYIEVYNMDKSNPNWYDHARSSASRLLSNVNICKRINELLDGQGLNDEFVDKQLLLIITQNADYRNKVEAIKEFNKLRSRIQDKLDLTSKGEKVATINVVSYVTKPEANIYHSSVQLPATPISTTSTASDGQRDTEGGDGVASEKREGQDVV